MCRGGRGGPAERVHRVGGLVPGGAARLNPGTASASGPVPTAQEPYEGSAAMTSALTGATSVSGFVRSAG